MDVLTLLLSALAGAIAGRVRPRGRDSSIALGRHVPFVLQSIGWDSPKGEYLLAPSNSTGDPVFDANFRIDPTGSSAPAYLDRPTRHVLLSWHDRVPIVIRDDRIEVGGPRLTAAELERLSAVLSGDPAARLMRIVRDRSEPLVLRRWAYDALPLVAGHADAQEFARTFDEREPVLRLRSAVLLDQAAHLRDLAVDRSTAIAVEAMAALAAYPHESNRRVVLEALGHGTDDRVVAALPLAWSCGLDAATLVGASRRLRGDAACEAFATVLGELGDPAATDFLLRELAPARFSATRVVLLDALAECAPLDALERIRAVVRTLHGEEREHGERAIERILERAGNPWPGRLTFATTEGGTLALVADGGSLSPAERSPVPPD